MMQDLFLSASKFLLNQISAHNKISYLITNHIFYLRILYIPYYLYNIVNTQYLISIINKHFNYIIYINIIY